MENAVHELVGSVPSPDDKIAYGTAGFRAAAERLPGVMARVGILAALRSKSQNSAIGVMVTASHNQVADNGVKIADPDGGMMAADWEVFATEIAKASTPESVWKYVVDLCNRTSVQLDAKCTVVIGMDTRPSSQSLKELVVNGAKAMGADVIDLGVLTTPQLHFAVRMHNGRDRGDATTPATEDGYYKRCAVAFAELCSLQESARKLFGGCDHSVVLSPSLVVDGADGVGGEKVRFLKEHLQQSGILNVDVINDGSGQDIALNDGCGAEFVQKERKLPRNVDLSKPYVRHCSLDGDADRVVYFYFDEHEKLHLFDGDKLTTLFSIFFKRIVDILEVDLSVGVVQTAYANGASSSYLRNEVGLSPSFVPTGVKYLHHKATEFDIGVYFEANGHGTVVFGDNVFDRIDALAATALQNEEKSTALKILRGCTVLINQSVGDAITDFLAVEVVLRLMNWNMDNWEAVYNDLPSRTLKLSVPDRTKVKTTWDEMSVLSPEGLQAEIERLSCQFSQGRSFVRPSGTEDVVRVYAEAAEDADAEQLGTQVCEIVKKTLCA